MRGQSVSSELPVIGQNPDQTPRGPECYYLFTTITADVVSFTLVAEGTRWQWKRWPFYQEGEFLLRCTCGAGTLVHCLRYLWRQDVKASLFYRIAAVLLLLFAVGHTLGFRQSDPTMGC